VTGNKETRSIGGSERTTIDNVDVTENNTIETTEERTDDEATMVEMALKTKRENHARKTASETSLMTVGSYPTFVFVSLPRNWVPISTRRRESLWM
jgi:hypothetical protein